MSISNIENYPTDADNVDIIDPEHDATDDVELSPGVNTDESDYFGRARRHTDPLGTALMRLGVGRSREVDQQPHSDGLLREPGHAEKPDPDAPFRARDLTSGTPEGPGERWIHDDALQVRQLVPTQFNNMTFQLTSPIPISVCPRRPERMTVILQNSGAAVVYIGRSGATSTPDTGFPIPIGGVLHLDVISAISASVVNGSPSTLAVLEQFRTDNRAE